VTSDQTLEDGYGEEFQLFAEALGHPRGVEYSILIHEAWDTVVRLRGFVPILVYAIEASEAEGPAAAADSSLSAKYLADETRRRIREEVDALISALQGHASVSLTDSGSALRVDETAYSDDPLGVIAKNVDAQLIFDLNRAFFQHFREMPDGEHPYGEEYFRTRIRPSIRQAVLRSQYFLAISLIQPMNGSLLLLILRAEQDQKPLRTNRATLDHQVFELLQRGPGAWHEKLMGRFDPVRLDRAIDLR
jgi:hypothetical protein